MLGGTALDQLGRSLSVQEGFRMGGWRVALIGGAVWSTGPLVPGQD